MRMVRRLVLGGTVGTMMAVTAIGTAAPAELAPLIEAAKKEGGVHIIDANTQPKTHVALDKAFRKKYGLPADFQFNHTLRGTGEVVAGVQQEIKAGQHTFDVVWVGAPAFFKAAAKQGHFLPYAPGEWKPYERLVKKLQLEADPPHWLTPVAYAFVPVWNRKCPGFANVQIKSWRDLLNPAFRGKLTISDVRRSFSFAATWVGIEGTLGKDYFPKLAELTKPVIFSRTEDVMQRMMSCEYPLGIWQMPGRVFQRVQEDPTLNLAVAWPEEGVTLLAMPMGIVKGTKHPNAAMLLVEFLLGDEGMREYIDHEAVFSLREGLKISEAAKRYVPDVETVKALPVNWPALTLEAIKDVQDDFRRVLKVD